MADGSIVISTALDSTKLNKQLNKLKTNLGSGLKKISTAATKSLAGITAGITAVSAVSVKISETTDTIDKMSQKIGISREAYQEWDFVLSQNGASVDGLQTSMKTLSAAADDLATGGTTYKDQFDKLGVSITDVNGEMKDQETLFNEVFTALSGVEDKTTRTAIASDLLGKSATELAPALNQGSAALEEQKQQAHELGLVLSDETVDAGVKLTDTMDQLKRSGTSVITSFLGPMITPLDDLLQGFIGLSTGAEDADDKIITSLTTMTTKVLKMLINIIPTVTKLAVNLVTALISGMLKALPALIESVSYLVGYIVGTIQDNSGSILETGKDILLWLINGITEIVPKVLTKIGNMVVSLVSTVAENKDKILEVGGNIITWIINGISNLLTTVAETAGTIINKLVTGIGDNKGSILETGLNLLKWLIKGVFNSLKLILDLDVKIIDALLTGITGQETSIIDIGKSVLTWFVSGITEIIKDVKGIGAFVVQGFIDGITAGKDLVVEKAKDFGNSFLGTVKGVFGIASPSKVMKKYGGYTVEGFNNGVEDAKNGAIKTAEDFGTETIEAISEATEEPATEAGAAIVTNMATGITENAETVIAATTAVTTSLKDSWTNAFENIKERALDWESTLTTIMSSVTDGFGSAISSMGEALASGEDPWASFAQSALSAIADILEALGKQLLALAVVNFFNFGAAAAYTAGAAAAYLASGYISSKAASYDVGGIIKEDQIANIHKDEIIVPAGLSQDAQQAGLMIAPMGQNNSSQNLNINGIVNVDGKKLARIVFENVDQTVSLAY